MALMEVNFFSKALMRPVTMNVILPVDKVFFGEETEEENKPFKTLYLLHGVMGNYTDWVTGTCIKRWAEEKNLAVVMPSGANTVSYTHLRDELREYANMLVEIESRFEQYNETDHQQEKRTVVV